MLIRFAHCACKFTLSFQSYNFRRAAPGGKECADKDVGVRNDLHAFLTALTASFTNLAAWPGSSFATLDQISSRAA